MGQEMCSCADASYGLEHPQDTKRSATPLEVAAIRQARAPPLPGGAPPPPSASLATQLWLMCEAGELAAAQRLVGRGARVNDAPADDELGRTPLVAAIESGHVDVVRWLVALPQTRVDAPCADGSAPLAVACELGDLELARLLVAHGAKPGAANKHGVDAFFAAAEAGQLEVLRWLTTLGATAATRDERKRTPLFAAVCHGQLTVVRCGRLSLIHI